jgi:hypothetical protein
MNKQSEAVGVAPVLSGWAQSPCAANATEDAAMVRIRLVTIAATVGAEDAFSCADQLDEEAHPHDQQDETATDKDAKTREHVVRRQVNVGVYVTGGDVGPRAADHQG